MCLVKAKLEHNVRIFTVLKQTINRLENGNYIVKLNVGVVDERMKNYAEWVGSNMNKNKSTTKGKNENDNIILIVSFVDERQRMTCVRYDLGILRKERR